MTKEENRRVLFKNTKYFIYKLLVSIGIRGILLVIPLYYSWGIDQINNKNFTAAYQMIIMFFVFTIIYRIFEVINQISFYKLYSNVYKTYLDLGLYKTCNNSVYSLSRFSLSEYSNIMSEDFEVLSDYYSALVMRIVEIMEFVYIIIYFFIINTLIGYMTLFVTLVVLFILIFFNSNIAKTNEIRKKKHDTRISVFQELLLSVKEIKGFNIFDAFRKRTINDVDNYVKWNNKLNVDKYNLKQVSLGLVDVFQFLALIVGIKLIVDGNMTIGMLTIIYSYYSKLSALFLSIITLSESLISVKVSKQRIHKLFQYANVNYEDKESIDDIKGEIEFVNVLYGNKQDPTLDNVSFTVAANTFTVISGLTGSGKTGIIDLLLRYNRQHVGDILIDGVRLNDYKSNEIGEYISAVSKIPTFFNVSIRENLSLFDSHFENIIRICKELEIHDYIMALPDGYDTILLTDASNINSDVKYILAIIRVLLKRSKIMLFDETFDFLSNDMSIKVLESLNSMKKENTIIIITKNKMVLESSYVDEIIMLDEHKILVEGNHQELIKNNKRYKEIVSKL